MGIKSIRFSVKDLKRAVAVFSTLKNASTILPILENMEIISDGKETAKLRATDLSIEVELSIPCISAYELHFIYPFKKLLPFITNTSDTTIDILVNDEDGVITHTVMTSEAILRMPEEKLNDYIKPKLYSREDVGSYIISSEVFNENLKHAARFVSKDDLRPAMTYVNLCEYKGSLCFTSTDAHKLFFRKSSYNYIGYNIMIPPRVALISKLVFGQDMPIYIYKSHGAFHVTNDLGDRISMRDPDERYPEWQTVLPKDDAIELFINRKRTGSVIKILNSFSGIARHLRFVIRAGAIELSAADRYGDSTEITSTIQVLQSNQKDEFTVGFDSRFFLEAISTKPKEDLIKITHTANPNKAIVINSEMLLMPVILNDHR